MTQPSATDAGRRASRNIRLGSLGAALEYYDFVVYLYVATLIGQAFFPADLSPTLRLVQTLAIYSTGLLIRPVAGVLIARVADRVGRKRLFILTVVVMSVATLGIGLLPTYEQVGWPAPALLLLLRVAQGCAVGGEIPAAAVFVTEHARPDGVARAGAFQQMTAYSGFLLGAAAAFAAGLVATHLTPDVPSLAWRLPFLVGGVLGAVSIYLRRRIDETPAFVRETGAGAHPPATPVREVLARHRSAVLFAVLVAVALTLVNVTYFNFWPTYLQTSLGFSSTSALVASLILIGGAMAAMPVWGYVADRYGWSRMLQWAAGATAATVLLLLVLPSLAPGSAPAVLIQLPVALAAAGIPAAAPGLIAAIFPTQVRQTGFSLPYNVVVAVLGGFLNLILVWLVATVGLRAPMYTVLVACVLVGSASVAVLRIRTYLGRGARPVHGFGGDHPVDAVHTGEDVRAAQVEGGTA
ncbi:MFS transporter [Pseudonocardia xishanensis]|uniref:MFS transporter n=1 Tax=Pseudonocardia xishanensis TaxID=630995 RepID=A0ABP8S237_9PSEU